MGMFTPGAIGIVGQSSYAKVAAGTRRRKKRRKLNMLYVCLKDFMYWALSAMYKMDEGGAGDLKGPSPRGK